MPLFQFISLVPLGNEVIVGKVYGACLAALIVSVVFSVLHHGICGKIACQLPPKKSFINGMTENPFLYYLYEVVASGLIDRTFW